MSIGVWPRLKKRLEWAKSFQLIFLFSPTSNGADALWQRFEGLCGKKGEPGARRLLLSDLDQLEGALPLVDELLDGPHAHQDSAGYLWIEALAGRDAAWIDAWVRLINRLNERREPLRERLRALVIVAPSLSKPQLQAAGPDLWSIRAAAYELGAVDREREAVELSPSSPLELAREVAIEIRGLVRSAQTERASWARVQSVFADSLELVESIAGDKEDTQETQRLRRELLSAWLELAELARHRDRELAERCLDQIVSVAGARARAPGHHADALSLAEAKHGLAELALADEELKRAELTLAESRASLARVMGDRGSPLGAKLELLQARLDRRQGRLEAARVGYEGLLAQERRPELLRELAGVLRELGETKATKTLRDAGDLSTAKVILHCSDLHFGPHSRFADLEPGHLGELFFHEIERARAEESLGTVDLVVVTGDLSESGKRSELEQAREFFEAFVEHMGITRDRFVFVPGNHDVSWARIRKARAEQEFEEFDDEELERRIAKEKLVDFEAFVDEFYGGFAEGMQRDRLVPRGWVHDIPELQLSIAALDSCERETDDTHVGFVSRGQARSLMAMWTRPEAEAWTKIVAVHHNPQPEPPPSVRAWGRWLEQQHQQGALTPEALRRASPRTSPASRARIASRPSPRTRRCKWSCTATYTRRRERPGHGGAGSWATRRCWPPAPGGSSMINCQTSSR